MDCILQNFISKAGDCNVIDPELYKTYNVKKGLRNEDGTGVLVGVTKIADVVGYKTVDGHKVDDKGRLFYRGIDIRDIINNKEEGRADLFEEGAFLILFGYLPTANELKEFKDYLSSQYSLPQNFLEHNILALPGENLLNKLQQTMLMLYNFDEDPDNTSPEAILEKGLCIIAKIPSIVCYIYQSKMNYYNNHDLVIKHPVKDLTIAENIIYMLDSDPCCQKEFAELLDLMLFIHADHGGGNNSTFINSVATSTLTDLYSAITGGMGAMKGPRHGAANIAVSRMMQAVKNEIGITRDKDKIRAIIYRLLNKDFFDKKGLIYGIGHAVYTLSDPRSEFLQEKCRELAEKRGFLEELEFYNTFAEIAIEVMKETKGINVCSNLDFYSGFAYRMMGIPEELYTLLFITARIVGWVAHNMEFNAYCDKIIRPATLYVGKRQNYVPRKDRV